MSLQILHDPVPLRTDATGVVRVGATRVTLDTVIGRYKVGNTPEEIHEGFPTLSLADIYAAIAYYLRHKQDVDQYLRARAEQACRLRQEIESSPVYQAQRDRIRARRKARDAGADVAARG